MGISEDILAELKAIRAALEGGATTAKTTTADKPKATTTKAKGPSLEEVQDKIRALADIDGMKDKIKEAITKLGGKRAGDFDGDEAKLTKLMAALTALEETPAEEEADDDLL